MLDGKTIAVVVPCYNEELQIGMVIETMPKFVDRIVIVNDKSKDKTSEVVKSYINNESNSGIELTEIYGKTAETPFNKADIFLEKKSIEEKSLHIKHRVVNENPSKSRIILIDHIDNGGVGASIATGYKWCKDHGIDCTAVMAGDGQMDPDELESICMPVIRDKVDYVKGNRLIHRSAKYVIPKVRFFGNSVLSLLTKIASGYWHVSDTQTGYTAISNSALNSIDLHDIYPRYGMPNDMLVKLNITFCTLREVEIKPVYNVGEQSKMKIGTVIPKISFLLLRLFFKRLWNKYLFRDFHPLFILYHLSFITGIGAAFYGLKIGKQAFAGEQISHEPLLAFLFLFVSFFQSLLFAMWMDMQDNERLYV